MTNRTSIDWTSGGNLDRLARWVAAMIQECDRIDRLEEPLPVKQAQLYHRVQLRLDRFGETVPDEIRRRVLAYVFGR